MTVRLQVIQLKLILFIIYLLLIFIIENKGNGPNIIPRKTQSH